MIKQQRFLTLAFVAALSAACAAPSPAAAADSLEIAKAIPTHLAEATSGGVWEDGGKSGVYRVMTVLVPEGESTASHIVVQWLALEEGKPEPVVIETVAIKEVNDQKLQGAFISLETEKDNEANLIVSSYDPIEDNDISITVRLTAPGKYEVAEKAKPE